jgi:hypothetical protein
LIGWNTFSMKFAGMFAMRYVHIYYGDHETKPDMHAGD